MADVCSICGSVRNPNLRFSKLKDGWICASCLKESAIIAEYPIFSERTKIINSSTADEMRERIESAQIVKKKIDAAKVPSLLKPGDFLVSTKLKSRRNSPQHRN